MLDDVLTGCRTLTAVVDDTSKGPRVLAMYAACSGAVEQTHVSAEPAPQPITDARNLTP